MKNLSYFLLLSLLLATACSSIEDVKKIKTPEYNPNLAFPVANATFTIQDMLDRFQDSLGYLSTVDDGIISVVYRGHVFTLSDTTIYHFPSIDTIPVPPTNIGVAFPSLQGELIKKINFKAGTLRFTVQNEPNLFAEDVEVKVHILNLKQNNQVVPDVVINIPKNTSSTTQLLTKDITLNGKVLDLAADNLSIYYDARTISTNMPVFFQGGQLRFSVLSPAYSYLQGKLPNYKFDAIPRDVINLKIFTNTVGGNVYFKDPRINIIIKNSYGVGIRMQADTLRAIDRNNFSHDFTLNNNPNLIFDFPYPSVTGQSKVDTFKFTGTNSNVEDVIALSPSQIVYKVSGELNPNNDPSGFVTDSSKFDVFVDVALPMYGRTSNLSYEKTFVTDFKSFKPADKASFKLITENGFPVDVFTQLYFVDKNNQVIDSIFKGNPLILKAAPVDGSGKVTTKATAINESSFSPEAFEKIKKATSIKVKAKLNTTDSNLNKDVKFYTDYGMTVKLGMIIGTNVIDVIK